MSIISFWRLEMHVNIVFLALTFIVILAVIMMSNDLPSAMMIISIIASFFVISTSGSKTVRTVLEGKVKNWGVPEPAPIPDEIITPETPVLVEDKEDEAPDIIQQNTNIYGAEYEKHNAYKDGLYSCYERPQPVLYDSAADHDTSVDGRNCLIAQRRARDKRCIDGRAIKNSDYYKYFYADELKAVETKPWWSRSEW